jgi:hypothetical protein
LQSGKMLRPACLTCGNVLLYFCLYSGEALLCLSRKKIRRCAMQAWELA